MASTDASDFRLSVLNPGGRDLEQYFDEPVGPTDIGHPPINLHAFAACTRGSFHRATKNAIEEKRPILLLLRGNFRATERALAECQKQKRTVTVAFIPTPYPLEDEQWKFAVAPNEQSGIFIGTREWDVPSRNHLATLLLAREICGDTEESITVFNLDGRRGEKLLAELKFPSGKLLVHDKREPYGDYRRQMARHKIVLQLDRSRVPGQVAGDALLCRTICLGSDGAIERLAFANFCGEGGTTSQIKTITLELLKNTAARAAAIVESQWLAAERISFQVERSALSALFDRIGKRPGD